VLLRITFGDLRFLNTQCFCFAIFFLCVIQVFFCTCLLFSYCVLGLDSYSFINEFYFDLDMMHHLERFYVFGLCLCVSYDFALF
jgi:hypothetical protein